MDQGDRKTIEARAPETGETLLIRIPAGMTEREWWEQYNQSASAVDDPTDEPAGIPPDDDGDDEDFEDEDDDDDDEDEFDEDEFDEDEDLDGMDEEDEDEDGIAARHRLGWCDFDDADPSVLRDRVTLA